jgi:hypothetical protein
MTFNTIFTLVTLALVVAVWGYVTYWHNRERLWRDLDKLVADALAYLKEWAKGKLATVTREEVAEVAGLMYERYVAGTPLGNLVSRDQFVLLVWEAFTRWRDYFAAMNQSLGVRAAR